MPEIVQTALPCPGAAFYQQGSTKSLVGWFGQGRRLGGVLLGVLFLQAPSAEAALILSAVVNNIEYCIPDNSNFGVCQGGLLMPDANPAQETVRALDAQALAGLGYINLIGQATFAPDDALTLTAYTLSNLTSGIIQGTLVLGQTNFFAESGAVLSVSGDWTGNVTPGLSFLNVTAFNDPANQQGAQNTQDRPGVQIGAFSTQTGGTPSAFSFTSGLFPISDNNGYSMALVLSFQLAPNASLNNLTVTQQTRTVSVTPVPEPASMLLLGTGLLGAGVRRWRQKRA